MTLNAEPKMFNMTRLNSLGLRRTVASAIAVLAFAGSVQADQLVYGNLGTSLGVYLGGFGPYGETADDVALAGGGIFTSARIAYAALGFDGNETLTMTLYRMDGSPTPGSFGFSTPGSVLFTQTIPLDGSGFANFSDGTGSVVLPDYIAVGLTFAGVNFNPATSDAGPVFYDPPNPGSSFNDYWLKGFAGDPDWALYDFGGNPPANFGMEIYVRDNQVPEGTLGLTSVFSVIGGLFLARRRQS